jgi:hypothetical protein
VGLLQSSTRRQRRQGRLIRCTSDQEPGHSAGLLLIIRNGRDGSANQVRRESYTCKGFFCVDTRVISLARVLLNPQPC